MTHLKNLLTRWKIQVWIQSPFLTPSQRAVTTKWSSKVKQVMRVLWDIVYCIPSVLCPCRATLSLSAASSCAWCRRSGASCTHGPSGLFSLPCVDDFKHAHTNEVAARVWRNDFLMIFFFGASNRLEGLWIFVIKHGVQYILWLLLWLWDAWKSFFFSFFF